MRIALVSMALFSACSSPQVERGVLEGALAQELRGMTPAGTDWQLEDQLGRPAVLVFWASWCGPCIEEVPHFNAIVEAYGDRVEVMGINMGEERSIIVDTQSRTSMRYATLLDEDKALASAWMVRRLPLLIVVDSEGRIRLRGSASEQELKVLLDSLVQV